MPGCTKWDFSLWGSFLAITVAFFSCQSQGSLEQNALHAIAQQCHREGPMDARSIRFKKEPLCVNALETMRTLEPLSWRLCRVQTSPFFSFFCDTTSLPKPLFDFYYKRKPSSDNPLLQKCVLRPMSFLVSSANNSVVSLHLLDDPRCYQALEQAFVEDVSEELSKRCYHPNQWNGNLGDKLLCFEALPAGVL